VKGHREHTHTLHAWDSPGPYELCVGCQGTKPSFGFLHCVPNPVLGCEASGFLCWECETRIEAQLIDS
jgi:hypothetical protein